MTRSIFLRTVFTIGAAILSLFERFRRRARWEYVGEANMDGGSDHDSIKVGASQGSFDEFSFGANAAIELIRKSLYERKLHSGSDQRSDPGGWKSREIEPAAKKRLIERASVSLSRGAGRKDRNRRFG
jgi:hypothetical protein